MTVYVDDWRQPATVGRHTSRWSHLFSNTSDEELHTFAASIGLKPEWFQKADSPIQTARHYDVTESKRRAAVAAGAVEISWRDAGAMRTAERERLKASKDARASVRGGDPIGHEAEALYREEQNDRD